MSQFFTNMNLQMLSQQLFRYKLLLGIYAQSESLNNSEGHNHRSYGHKTNNYTHSLSFLLFCFLINSLQVCLLVVCKNLYVHLFRFSPLFVCFIWSFYFINLALFRFACQTFNSGRKFCVKTCLLHNFWNFFIQFL